MSLRSCLRRSSDTLEGYYPKCPYRSAEITPPLNVIPHHSQLSYHNPPLSVGEIIGIAKDVMHMHARSGSCIPDLVHECTRVDEYTRSRTCMLTGFGYTRVHSGMNVHAWVYSIIASMHEHAHYICAYTCILIPSVHTRICSYQLWSLLLTLCDPCDPTDMDNFSLPFTVLSSTHYDCLLTPLCHTVSSTPTPLVCSPRVILLPYDWSFSSSIRLSLLLSSIIDDTHHSRFSVSISILRIERLLSVANTTHNRWIALLYHRYTLHLGTRKNPFYSFYKQLYKTILFPSRLW